MIFITECHILSLHWIFLKILNLILGFNPLANQREDFLLFLNDLKRPELQKHSFHFDKNSLVNFIKFHFQSQTKKLCPYKLADINLANGLIKTNFIIINLFKNSRSLGLSIVSFILLSVFNFFDRKIIDILYLLPTTTVEVHIRDRYISKIKQINIQWNRYNCQSLLVTFNAQRFHFSQFQQ